MKTKKNNDFLELFISFLKIGAFTFGGGYAMIPFMQEEATQKHKWVEESEILEMVAIAESTPGVISINLATFIGYRVKGTWGAFCATLGVVLPAFMIISILSFFIEKVEDYEAIQFAFNGVRVGVLALVSKSLYSMAKQCPKNTLSYCIAGGTLIGATWLGGNVVLMLAISAVVGLVATLLARKRGK